MGKEITEFFRDLQRCRLCYGAKERIFVPGPDGGRQAPADILIIREQPNTGGPAEESAAETAASGSAEDRLQEFLEVAGIAPEEVFCATAVLCRPCKNELRPGRPSSRETRNCAPHLRNLIRLVRPRLIIPLGHTAVQVLQWVFEDWTELRQYILNYDVGNVLERKGVAVYPLCHTSQSTAKKRSHSRQLRDWKRIPSILESLGIRSTTR